MMANPTNSASACEPFLAELTAAALDVASRFGVGGPSIDLEIDLWHEFDGVLRDWQSRPASLSWDDRLAALSAAAYQVMLNSHFRGAFVDLEMDLWRRLRQVIRRNRIFLAIGTKRGENHGRSGSVHLSGVLAIA
jgi:hypothetical protein